MLATHLIYKNYIDINLNKLFIDLLTSPVSYIQYITDSI